MHSRTTLVHWHKSLAQAERLEVANDIFFITLAEAHAALEGTDLRSIVRERHTIYGRELKRRHIPRVLLSDGTEPGIQKVVAQSNEGIPRTNPSLGRDNNWKGASDS